MQTHTVHLKKHPAYPERAFVEKVNWNEEVSTYVPVEFTHAVVLKNDCTKVENGWADPAVITKKFHKELLVRLHNESRSACLVDGMPRNPVGRTGMKGRGLLGKYGPNYAADPLVTRYSPETGKLQMVAIKRTDTGDWAIPGGMVDAGEKVSATLKREFTEEAMNLPGKEYEIAEQLDNLFRNGEVVYIGYVDDPRNTDDAWMETTCVHFRVSPELAPNLKLGAGDDASHVKWIDIHEDNPEFKNLYASHKEMVMKAVGSLC
jgi:ADP-ribose pyrophosphatase